MKGNLVCCCASNQPWKLPLRLSSFYWKLLQTTTPSIHNKEAFFNYSRRKNYNWKLIGEWHHLYRLPWKSKNLHEGRENNREWNFPLILLTIPRPWFPQNFGRFFPFYKSFSCIAAKQIRKHRLPACARLLVSLQSFVAYHKDHN